MPDSWIQACCAVLIVLINTMGSVALAYIKARWPTTTNGERKGPEGPGQH